MNFKRFENYRQGPVAVFSMSGDDEFKLDKHNLTSRINNLKVACPQANVDTEMAVLAQMIADEFLLRLRKPPNVGIEPPRSGRLE